jgi:hypothetical protein
VTWVRVANVLGHQQLDRLTQQLGTAIPEQPLCLRIHQRDQPIRAHPDNRVGRRFQQPGRPELTLPRHRKRPLSDGVTRPRR